MNRALVNCEIISSYDKGCNYSKFEENYKFTDLIIAMSPTQET